MIFRSRPLHTSADVDIKIWPCLGHYVLGKTDEVVDVVDVVDLDVDIYIWQCIIGNYTVHPSADVWDYFHSGLEKTTASHWLLPSCPLVQFSCTAVCCNCHDWWKSWRMLAACGKRKPSSVQSSSTARITCLVFNEASPLCSGSVGTKHLYKQ